jgi:hypothetical protein
VSVADDQEGYEDGGGGGDIVDSGGLGLPKIAERIEYSRLAASEPKEKLGSKGDANSESAAGNVSAGVAVMVLDKMIDDVGWK